MKTNPKAKSSLQSGLAAVVRDVWAQVTEWWLAFPARRRRQFQQILLAISLLASVIIMVTGVGIYILGWQNGWTLAVSRFVPYPAVLAKQEIGSYRDYMIQVNSVRGQAATELAAKQVSQQAMGQVINTAFLNAYAQTHRISVSRSEVQAELKRIYTTQGGEKEGKRILKQHYHISGSDYARLVTQQLLRQKVERALTSDRKLRSAAHQKAIDLLKQIQKGADFAVLAQGNSQHPSAVSEGAAQLVNADTLPTEVAQAAARLKQSQVSSVIETTQAYYIVKREATGLRVIEIRNFNAGQWLSQQYDGAVIIKLLHQAR